MLMELVVLPTPPFWLHMAMMRAGPCCDSGFGAGNVSYSRPSRSVGIPFTLSSPVFAGPPDVPTITVSAEDPSSPRGAAE